MKSNLVGFSLGKLRDFRVPIRLQGVGIWETSEDDRYQCSL